MAKKRRASPLDEPPTASSSSDEEEEQKPSQESQPKEDEVEEEDQSSSGEEEEEDESEEEENPPPVLSQSATKNPPPPPPTKSQPKPSSSESESGTDSDSDDDNEAPPPNSKVKPLASKPMDQNPNSKTKAQIQTQTQTPSSPPPNKAGTKRQNNNAHANDSKRAKKKSNDTAVPAASAGGSDDEMETEEDAKKSGEDSKKMFQRVWSEEDEITIVKSMTDFISKTGNDPLKYIAAFYEFVKKLLSFDATSTQLRQKIRRIKDKYNVAVQKRRKNGVDPTFSKPHDQKLYDLSKKVWGKDSDDVEEKGKSNGRTPKSPKKEAPTKNTASAKKPARTKKPVPEASEETESPAQVVAVKESAKGESDDEVVLSEMLRFDKGMGISGLSEAVVQRGLEFMDGSKKAALVEKWKKLRAEEFQLFVKRATLTQEQAILVFEAYQSSNP